ncbi:MAG: hypothetical protein ABL888_18760 [Pirellulaceae bacterium]
MTLQIIDEKIASDLIDLLVADELDESHRTRLIHWLEESPERWRKCGLAFLEAQIWQASFHEIATDKIVAIQPVVLQTAPKALTRNNWVGAVVAAGLVLAFVGGYWWPKSKTSGEIAARTTHVPSVADNQGDHELTLEDLENQMLSVDVFRASDSGPMQKIQVPIQAVKNEATVADVNDDLPAEVRRHWESRGFRLKQGQRFLPAKLPDGQQVMLPINQIVADFIGKKVY